MNFQLVMDHGRPMRVYHLGSSFSDLQEMMRSSNGTFLSTKPHCQVISHWILSHQHIFSYRSEMFEYLHQWRRRNHLCWYMSTVYSDYIIIRSWRMPITHLNSSYFPSLLLQIPKRSIALNLIIHPFSFLLLFKLYILWVSHVIEVTWYLSMAYFM